MNPTSKRRVLVLATLAVAALAAASYGAYWWHSGRFMQTTDDAYVGGDISAISSKISGYIQQLAVQDNMAVKKGDLLIRIDDRDYRAALAKAAGEVAAQQAALADVIATRQLQQATIAGSAASLQAATAAAEKLANDNRRYHALAASSAISAQIRDNASADYRRARGATPLAELVGYGTSADAYHLTAGPEDGNGARRAMEMAIRQAGVTAEEIGHINAHATSTQVGDKGELAAIKSLFATHPVAITSTKSATGHLLGAAGGIEAIFTIQALRDQIVPPTLNLHHPDEDAEGLNLVALVARPQKMRYALSNGFGFGGVNASLLLKRWE
ncbi:biotin/lipoyl-binding protein [Raoultella ornithinolytica]|uniref:biotin/lipoyl-binding protein n=1 Tax=Raoultella ornithinolytica TaxID=54291 RepID=UPI002A5AADF8|nr:biotin/lipoyl-binding protein [Raoultella ornithinolytica]WPO26519.1 biotin/lipoyl-binding protein [Raoultella ornithinolytica]